MFWQVDRGPGGLNLAPTQLLVSGCWSLVYGAIRCPKLTYYWLLSYGFIITSDFLNVFHGCPKNQSNKIKSWIYVSVDVCWSSSAAHLIQDTPMHTNSRLLNRISLGCKPPKSWAIALFLTITELVNLYINNSLTIVPNFVETNQFPFIAQSYEVSGEELTAGYNQQVLGFDAHQARCRGVTSHKPC